MTLSESASIRQHQAVAHHVERHVEHVLRQRVVAAAHEGQRPRGQDQVDRRARAGAERDVALQLLQAVLLRRRAWRSPGARRTRSAPGRRRRWSAGRCSSSSCSVVSTFCTARDVPVIRSTITNSSVGAGIADQHLEHEAVDLRLGQRIGALGLDRVLGRQHQERVRHLEGLAADRDLALLHHFEQRALHLGRRAVDLVGQQQVGEDRAERGVELAGLLVVDPRADQVGRAPGRA